MVRKFDRISIEFSIEFFGRKFYRIFLAGLTPSICCVFRDIGPEKVLVPAMTFKGHSSSSAMSQFDRSHMLAFPY